ncbi:aryl-alcohol-oxidase from pleurotus Eryingii [Mycena amicta]|nr:aryl-alcohol-oxidase from pleurotus Eryingii [Mycena amicta]
MHPQLSLGLLLALSLSLQTVVAKIYTAPEQIANKQYDYIVVGAGTAGAVVAARISQLPAVKVLVIEAGLLDNGTQSDLLSIPLLAGQAANTIYDWNYTTVPQTGLDGNKIPLPRGFVVGGSSNLNNLVYMRGPKDEWARMQNVSGDSGWSWDNLQKYIFMNEQHASAWNHRCNAGEYNPVVHGNGPLLSSLTAMPNELDSRVLKAATELKGEFGPYVLDFNGGIGLGVGWIETTVGDSARSSSATAFMHPALDSQENLDLLINTQVTRLLPKTSGSLDFRTVEVSQGAAAPTYTFVATSEVILAAGAIGTPQILQLSGIGPKATLKTAGVTQLVDLPAVGSNLQDQALVFFHWAVNGSTLTDFLNDPAAIGAALQQYATNKTGIAASSVVFNTIGFLRLPESCDLLHGIEDPAAGPNSAHFQYSFLNAYAANPGQTGGPTSGDFISVSILVQSPTSAGSVNIVSKSPFVHPAIDPAYYTTKFDIGTAVEAVKTLEKIFAADAFHGFIGQPTADTAAALKSDAAIESYIRKFSASVKHPTSSARISKVNDTTGVVGPDLFVHKITGVRVVDASVLPFAPAGFPQAEVYIIAERAAALIMSKFDPFLTSK